VYRYVLAPRWLAWHAALVVVLVSFTLLGRWQLNSFEHADRQTKTAAAPVAIGTVTRPGGRLSGGASGTAVTATGRYDGAHQLVVPSRRLGNRDGYLVVTPLRIADGVVPVNRGWVATLRDHAVRVPGGQVTVTGVLQPSESQDDSRVDLFAPLPRGQVPYLATVQLLTVLPYPSAELYDGYVVLTGQQPAADPSPQRVEPRQPQHGVGRWRNLAYALQWWLFAGAAVFFWWSVIRRSRKDEQATEGTGDAEPAPV
jgi:cytochrome oxidase assembly protein ShyY1